MNLRPEQLPPHLEAKLAPLYVVHGDEPLLALEAADQVRAAAVRRGHGEREVITVEPGFNWSSLLQASASLSLFASRRLLDIRIPSGKPGTEGAKALQAFCAVLPQDTITLVNLPKLDRQAQNSQWFKALEGAGVVVQVYPLDRSRLPQWIAQRLAAQGQRAGADTLQFLADAVEGNLLAARQELQKLALLLPSGELTFEQVKDAVLDVARYDVYRLGDAMLAGDAPRLVRMMAGLQGEGMAPTLVLWAVVQEIRILAKLKHEIGRGGHLAQAARAARIRDARLPLVEKALARLSRQGLEQALEQAAAADRLIKGLGTGDIWDVLLQLALGVCRGNGRMERPARNGK